jgi:uncharacterized membrane protein
VLILGLVIFLGVHSIRLVADSWRSEQIARIGENGWKGLYSLASLVGFVLIVWGYGRARRAPVLLWVPPVGMMHLTALLVAIAFVLFAASYVPRNHIKRVVGHPMMAGVALWAIGHLVANGTLDDVLLFGAFFIWSAAGFLIWRRRDSVAHRQYPAGNVTGDAWTVIAGLIAWGLFAFFLHGWLIGVKPLG